jgi:hypothetical protein
VVHEAASIVDRSPHPKSESPSAHVNWLELDRSPHAVHFYSSESFLLDSVSRFVGTALQAGDSSFAIATQVHLDGLAERLKRREVDTDTAVKKGRYITLDARQALAQLTAKGKLDKTRFDEFVRRFLLPLKAAAEGRPQRVAGCGELVALLWAEGKGEVAIELEHLWNELAKQGSFSFRCVYPIASFSDSGQSKLFLRLCAEHASVIPRASRSALLADEEYLPSLPARVRQFETPGTVVS